MKPTFHAVSMHDGALQQGAERWRNRGAGSLRFFRVVDIAFGRQARRFLQRAACHTIWRSFEALQFLIEANREVVDGEVLFACLWP
jgi:hypothetical protein